MKNFTIAFLLIITLCSSSLAQNKPAFYNESLPVKFRVSDLVSRLTLEEKAGQMIYNSPAISRLGIPEYNWWNEGLHGVARSGVATIFPQAIGMAATFNDNLINQVAAAVSDEARAMYNVASAKNYRLRYEGLTFWTPNINIFRDPRWGRGQETYGEDPYLTSKMGVAFVKGLQGKDPKYLKIAACAKHFAVHSGPERLRHEFNAKVSLKDLYETYLPAFHALVDAKVEAVMCAYNRTNDEPCCANTFLLQDVLRKEWNFKGHVVSDCWALVDFYQGHKVVTNSTEAAALALSKGVDLNCGSVYNDGLVKAVKQGLVSEKQVDSALNILLQTKFKLGMFDVSGKNPYDKIPASVINSKEHRALARKVAQQSIVMLKNNGVLPLKNDLPKYFVTGPNATSIEALHGNYFGVNSNMVTVLEGIANHIKVGSQVQYAPGTLLDRPNINPIDWASDEAKNSTATIVVMGITGMLEGEEGESIASPSFGDRLDYNLPKNQIDFLKKMKSNNDKPIIAVITGGSPMNLVEVQQIADAVLLVWYPGEEGGNAVADIIFGEVSPSGKLPITFPKSLDQLPDYQDYAMKGRTYRFMEKEPLYPFGFGLSYTKFEYSNLVISSTKITTTQIITAAVTVTNIGKKDGEEVLQLYVSHPDLKDAPIFALKKFKRITTKAGTSTKVTFTITPEMLVTINEAGKSVVEKGTIKIYFSGSLPTARSEALGASKSISTTILIQ